MRENIRKINEDIAKNEVIDTILKKLSFTNKFETMPRVHPTLSPIRSNEKRSINRFLILVVIDLPYKIFL